MPVSELKVPRMVLPKPEASSLPGFKVNCASSSYGHLFYLVPKKMDKYGRDSHLRSSGKM